MSGDGEEEKHGSAATESNVTDCISPWPCMSLSSLRYRLKVTLVGSAKVNIISEMKVTREAYYLLLRVGTRVPTRAFWGYGYRPSAM